MFQNSHLIPFCDTLSQSQWIWWNTKSTWVLKFKADNFENIRDRALCYKLCIIRPIQSKYFSTSSKHFLYQHDPILSSHGHCASSSKCLGDCIFPMNKPTCTLLFWIYEGVPTLLVQYKVWEHIPSKNTSWNLNSTTYYRVYPNLVLFLNGFWKCKFLLKADTKTINLHYLQSDPQHSTNQRKYFCIMLKCLRLTVLSPVK